MIDCEGLKEQVYWAMPLERITTERLARQLRMEKGRLAFILKLLRLDGRVEYLDRHYDPSVKTLRAFWKRK
jgi:hypothetical protein